MSKILLVEDNPDAVKRIIRYINKIFAELDVVSFPEAGDALQYAKANDISLFILDIQLEDYKGTNLAKQLRELPEYKYTPIIFETALAGEELSAYQLIGSWLIFGICMWIGHFTGRKWTIRIVIVLYVLSAVWIKLPAIQNIPLTSFNHLLILHHNFGEPARPWSTGFTLLLFMLTIMFSVRFAWRGHLPQLRLKCHGIAAYYSYELMTKRNILILLAVVVGITLYKGLGYGAAESDAEWIYSLFAGHGTGYFQVFPFLEMLITSGVPLYLLAAFVEHTVNGQSIFISVRAKSRRHLVKGILSVSTKFLIIYAFFWLMAGLIGASLFSTGLTIVSFRLMLYAVLMKCLDILVQYLIVLGIYIATRQVTIGFLVLVAGNLLCILPGNWVAYSPFGLSSLTRISVVEPGIGISAVSAFGIEAAILTLMIAGILMWGYKKILN